MEKIVRAPKPAEDLRSLSSLTLAYLGDGVFELLVRESLIQKGTVLPGKLHKSAVEYVKAQAQARLCGKLTPLLTDTEAAVYRRGRNAKVSGIPQNATYEEYHAATGLEAVFGWLYLQGETERINELFRLITEDSDVT